MPSRRRPGRSSWSSRRGPGVLSVRVADRVGKGIRIRLATPWWPTASTSPRGLAFGVHRAGDTAGAVVGVLIALAVVVRGEGMAGTLTAPLFRTLVLVSIVPAVFAVAGLALLAREAPGVRRPGPLPSLRLGVVRRPVPMVPRHHGAVHAGQLVRCLPGPAPAMWGFRSRGSWGWSCRSTSSTARSRGRRDRSPIASAGGPLLVAGWLLYALIYLGFARITTGWQAWALMTAYGVHAALTDGVAKAFVADLVPSSLRGTAYGVFHTAVGLGALPASLLAGIAWEGLGPWHGWGPSAPFYLGAGSGLPRLHAPGVLPGLAQAVKPAWTRRTTDARDLSTFPPSSLRFFLFAFCVFPFAFSPPPRRPEVSHPGPREETCGPVQIVLLSGLALATGRSRPRHSGITGG